MSNAQRLYSGNKYSLRWDKELIDKELLDALREGHSSQGYIASWKLKFKYYHQTWLSLLIVVLMICPYIYIYHILFEIYPEIR